METKRLELTINCSACYVTGIDVPADLNFEEAIEYAKQHLDEAPLTELTYMEGSDELDIENCNFAVPDDEDEDPDNAEC